MSLKFRLCILILSAILMPAALSFARGGGGGGHGGGGGGGHGGGGGGGHGGGGGGGHSMYSGSGGSSSRSLSSGGSSSSVRSFNSGNSFSSNLGKSSANSSTFMKNNFPSQHQASHLGSNNAMRHEVNRPNNFTNSSLNKQNSFVQKNNISSKDHNQWTHNNGKNNWNKNGNWNKNNNWNKNANWNKNWNHNHWNPWWGWGGLGFWGWGIGWPYWSYAGYGYPYYGYNYYGYGNGYSDGYAAYAAPLDGQLAQADDIAPDGQFADQGEADFKAGNYKAAARDWQHALVDDPRNGAIMMLLGQTLFALGQYEESAGATQAAMQMLPEDKWGVVVQNYSQLYGNVQDYTNQLKALEKARDSNPESPALRFLLGFHFGYLNYPKNAVKELDKGLTTAPEDLGSFKLRQIFAAKWPEAPAPPSAAVEAAKKAESQQQQPGGNNAAPAPSDAQPGTSS